MLPKVSVLTSVYNGLPYLRESIDSILKQTYTDFEFIIIDDCSTDESWKVLTEYAEKDKRIRLFKNEENLGLTKSLNKGLKLAQGKYIARQDADDISLPERFEKEFVILEEDPDIILVSCIIESMDSQGQHQHLLKRDCESELIPWCLLFYNYIGGHSQVLFRREQVLELGGYDEQYRYAQDYELWTRLSEIGKLFILPEVLLKYRVHSETISAKGQSKQEESSLIISRNKINNLTKKDLTMTEILNLKSFWLIGLRSKYPEINFDSVNHNLRMIYNAFIFIEKNKARVQSKFHLEGEKQLSHIISQRFYDWAGVFKSINKIKALNLLLYAFMWNRKKTLSLIFKKFI